jgi:hypothetical protein
MLVYKKDMMFCLFGAGFILGIALHTVRVSFKVICNGDGYIII